MKMVSEAQFMDAEFVVFAVSVERPSHFVSLKAHSYSHTQ